MSEAPSSPARPAVVLGLTFLAIALTFALPFRLIPGDQLALLSGRFSPEVANVYAVVAWAGWAHFIYAFRGQGAALRRLGDRWRNPRTVLFLTALAATIGGLVLARDVMGAALFGGLVWIYFIDHFLKAELAFEGKAGLSAMSRWMTSYQVLVSFAWLSVILLDVGGINGYPWLLWGGSLGLGAVVLLLGGWQQLTSGAVRGPLLSLFFISEAMVWGTFSQYGGPMFLTGVYVFHIAAGSYFHYFGSYFVGNVRSAGRDRLLRPLAIVGVNAVLIAVGIVVSNTNALAPVTFVFGVAWFPLWVGVHLIVSDFFPVVKRWRKGTEVSPRLVEPSASP